MSTMMHYAWFIWSLGFFVVWLVLYSFRPDLRKEMLLISLLTMPLGLTEPLFVPEYWSPPSLFNLAQKTGFDVESLIFSFSIGGIGAVIYNLIFKIREIPILPTEKERRRHQWHGIILGSPILIYLILDFTTSLKHIYSAVFALFLGALLTLYCRPDLKVKIWVGGFLFLVFYSLFFLSLTLALPDYVEKVWNLKNLTGIFIFGIPIEEFLFAFSFGMLWSSLYEHLFWLSIKNHE